MWMPSCASGKTLTDLLIRFFHSLHRSKAGFLVGAAFVLGALHAKCESPTSAVHRMSNGIIEITLMDPNAPHRYYRGARFSPAAFVMTATKGGNSYLFCPTDHDPELDGAGLAMEFDILTKGGPPGFYEAAVGDGFLKIGVGVLRKQENHYRFERPQEIIERAVTTFSFGNEKAVFSQSCEGVNGYAYSLTSTVTLQDNVIVIDHTLTNTGARAFTTENYAHNYLSFDGRRTGPGYEITFPYDISEPAVEPLRRIGKGMLAYVDFVDEPVNHNVPYPSDHNDANSFAVHHIETGMTIEAVTSVPGTRTFLNATPAYLSPEQFIKISLEPGQHAEWTRTYRLESK